MSFEGTLPVMPPLVPMLAKGVERIPVGGDWVYEPKWDGFRALVFRDGAELELISRSGKSLTRYFPELRVPLLAALPERCVVDGELLIRLGGGLNFGLLQLRLHPAATRVEKLAGETPAQIVLWDLLAVGETDLMARPFLERRARLEGEVSPCGVVRLTPITSEISIAEDWFERFEGAGLDGVIAKLAAGAYEPGKRVMRKIKHTRSVDCVLVGFRWHAKGHGVGSLILGLYDADGSLHQLGVASSFTKARRAELVGELEPLREGAAEAHPWRAVVSGGSRRAGSTSRWNAGKNLAWEPLRLERVVEVSCNQMSGARFRHPAKFLRWREDREPSSCTFDQLAVLPAAELSELLG